MTKGSNVAEWLTGTANPATSPTSPRPTEATSGGEARLRSQLGSMRPHSPRSQILAFGEPARGASGPHRAIYQLQRPPAETCRIHLENWSWPSGLANFGQNVVHPADCKETAKNRSNQLVPSWKDNSLGLE